MTATINVTGAIYTYQSDSDFRTSVVAGLAALGITGSDIVYNSGADVIAKISNGTGTYADNYLRFAEDGGGNNRHLVRMGTGYTSGNDVTGSITSSNSGFFANNIAVKHRTIKADDGSFGVVQLLNATTNVVQAVYGFIKTTNTTESAANIPLAVGICSIVSDSFADITSESVIGFNDSTSDDTGFGLKFQNQALQQVSLNPFGNMRLVYSDVTKGSRVHDALGHSGTPVGGSSSSSTTNYGSCVNSITFGLDSNVNGDVPIVPNVLVKSGGVPIGHNSNLVYCPPNLNPGDNIIVTAGSEEYTVISCDGIAIRKV